jgi:hypothetical protein
MDSRIAILLKASRERLDSFRARTLPCIRAVIHNLKTQSTAIVQRLKLWLQVNWPPFKAGLLAQAGRIFTIITRLTRQTIILAGQFLSQARVMAINAAGHTRRIASVLYNDLQQWRRRTWSGTDCCCISN